MHKLQVICIISAVGLAIGAFVYAMLMRRLARRNLQPDLVRSFAWKISLGCALLTVFMALAVKS